MSLASSAARVIRQQLRAHVAWLPLANNFELGDFGVVSGGVFTRLGNVRSLGVRFKTRSTAGAPFEFRSGGTTEVTLDADAKLDIAAGLDASAGLRIAFASAESLFLRAAEIVISEIDELLPVAAVLRNHSQWRLRYRVVHKVWTGHDAIFITSAESDAVIDLRGSLEAIQGLRQGRANLDLQVHNKTNVGLDLIGHTGPIALGLFRVRLVGGDPELLDFSVGAVPSGGVPYELDQPGEHDEPVDDL
ncbi:hypothetical protein [Nannocystis sp.]|uniref:hypothetical protein n=1 Tax=Nannocystis sp. TaxID=1962667 RepID=UPI00242787A8|nr:hypothetical protein [Nannocystis sp.]MBK7829946.1 hypothetical protein [Nannocystis sp.]MBK9757839.1 hypothetical protein [Nannocystis sp.]